MRLLRSVTTGLALATVAAVVCAPAQAYQVVAFPDHDSELNSGCALREAIETLYTVSNVDTCILAGSAGNDEILLVTGAQNFPIQLASTNEDLDANGDFDIRKDLTITGDGAANSTIDGMNVDRVFDVQNGATLTLRDVTVTNGKAPNGAAGQRGGQGGGIRATGGLVLDGVVVTNNKAGNGGAGANANPGQAGGPGGDGGGIYSLSFVTITDSTISLNTAGTGGPGGNATGSCTTLTTGGQGGFGGFGGGIAADNGGAIITGSTITQNMAGFGGNGGCASNPGSGQNAGFGGGISVSNLTLTNSIVSDNQTRVGGLAAQDFDSANTAGSGRGGDGGGIYAYTSATISGSTISGNFTGAGNGNATGTTGNSPGNQAGDGGGALLQGSGSITNTTFANNQTGNGKSSTGSFGGPGGSGGGLALMAPDFFPGEGYVISNSTFNDNSTGAGGNSASAGFPGGSGGSGGGIFIGSNTSQPKTASVVNSTLNSNSTGAGGNNSAMFGFGGAGGRGGAIGVGEFSTVGLTHLTVADNTTGNFGTGGPSGTDGARSDGGAVGSYTPFTTSPVTVTNSILASNVPATCEALPDPEDTIADGGHNLVFGTQCADITAFSTADPLLAALADNGGPTQTRAIGDASPAKDAVPSTGAGCTAADQRGTTRPQGSACDAGAFEIFVPLPPDTGGGGGGGGSQTQTPITTTEQQPTTQPPPPDKTPPVVKLVLTKQKLLKALKKGYFAFFTDNELGNATGDLYAPSKAVKVAKSTRVAHGTLKVTKTGKQKLVVKFTRKAKKALAKKKKVTLTLMLTVKDAAGNATKKTAKLTLKR